MKSKNKFVGVGWGQGECERRFEVFVKMQKNLSLVFVIKITFIFVSRSDCATSWKMSVFYFSKVKYKQ